jgi:hypothetical protein
MNQTTADQLLETARAVLRDELLPALPSHKRHAALMVANAMAIAGRQLKAGDAPEREELAALELVLGLPADGANRGTPLRAQLAAANGMLCAQLREGLADDGAMRERVFAHLRTVARRKVEESNPKYLTSVGPGESR